MSEWARDNVTGLILNGGASRRFGSDKAALRVAGRTLLERTLDLFATLFDEVLVVGRPVPSSLLTHHASRITGNVPRPASRVPAPPPVASSRHAARGTRQVPDVIPGAGPLGGIYTGLLAMSRPFGFFVACDMPLLDATVVRRQLEVLRESDADAVVPTWDGYLEPLHAAYSQDCLPAVRRQLESGDVRIRRFFDSVNVLYWDVAAEGISPRAFANVNTKSDLVALFRHDPQWRTD